MISRANCSLTDYPAVSNWGEDSVYGDNLLFQNRNSDIPYFNKFLRRRLLNPMPVGSNCTVYKSASSPYDMRPAYNNYSRNIIQEPPLPQMHTMDKRDGDQFVRRHSPAVERLHNLMAARGLLVQYTMLSTEGLMPSRIFTYNAKCGNMVTYGCGPSTEEAVEDAAAKFLEKLEFTPVQVDDHLLNSMSSLDIESKVNMKYNNCIGILQEYCQARGLDLPKYEYHKNTDIKNKSLMFSVICSIGQFKSTGVGTSKQIAKNLAARLTYNQIISSNAITNQNLTSNSRKKKPIDFGQSSSKNEAKNDAAKIALDHGKNKTKLSFNYIGTLQEKCVARGWELPKYEYYQENIDEIHKLFYSVICSVGPHKSTGVGSSKQVAKNQAAQFVYDQINLDQEKTSVLHSNYAHDKVDECKSNVMKQKNIDPCDWIYPMKLWYRQLSSSKKECMQKLKGCISWENINMTPFEFLTKLANEEDFNATYEQLSNNDNEKPVYGAIRLYVATKFIVMFIGEGITDAEAQNSVAKNTLTFIKHIKLNI
ncbi:hypothetical protein QTP88_020827 [Uroleucon formosanum]